MHKTKICKTTYRHNVLQRWNRYIEGLFPNIKKEQVRIDKIAKEHVIVKPEFM